MRVICEVHSNVLIMVSSLAYICKMPDYEEHYEEEEFGADYAN